MGGLLWNRLACYSMARVLRYSDVNNNAINSYQSRNSRCPNLRKSTITRPEVDLNSSYQRRRTRFPQFSGMVNILRKQRINRKSSKTSVQWKTIRTIEDWSSNLNRTSPAVGCRPTSPGGLAGSSGGSSTPFSDRRHSCQTWRSDVSRRAVA